MFLCVLREQAGARKVFAVEASGMANFAQQLAAKNTSIGSAVQVRSLVALRLAAAQGTQGGAVSTGAAFVMTVCSSFSPSSLRSLHAWLQDLLAAVQPCTCKLCAAQT